MIVVDTHIIIWNALQPEKLSLDAQKAITNANQSDGIIFCEISLWEIAMLIKKQRIYIETDFLRFVHLLKNTNRFIFKGLSPAIADLSVKLPEEINSDPADRLIAATAIIENIPLVTADKNLRESSVLTTIW